MKNQKVLIGYIVVLVAALIFETAYLLRIHQVAAGHKVVSYPHLKQPQRPMTTSLRLWSDWPAFSDEQDIATNQWEPFREMERIQRQMNRLFRDSFEKAVQNGDVNSSENKNFFEPEVDVKQADAAYIIQMDIPGLTKDQISLNIRDNFLVVSGERKREVNEQQPGGAIKEEREFGYFLRSIPLPQDAREGDIKSKYENGVLVVTIPRSATNNDRAKQPVSIKID